MRRVYTDVSAFRAPYRSSNVSFAGLGADHRAYDANRWPARRSYWSTHFYRAPYQAGYYQSGALRGPEPAQASMTGAQKWTIGALIAAAIVLGVMGDKLTKRA